MQASLTQRGRDITGLGGEIATAIPDGGRPSASLRDRGLYSSRNTSKGALLTEAAAVVGELASGLTVDHVRTRVLEGTVLRQRTRVSRQRVWQMLHYRLFAHQTQWVIKALKEALGSGPHSPEFVSLLYVLYALRDRLSFDIVTELLWRRWLDRRLDIARNDVMSFLDEAAEAEPQIRRWSLSSREKLAGSILTAIRDFGVMDGKQKKRIACPILPSTTAEHVLHILTAEGVGGADVLRDPTWRLFLCSETDVANALCGLAQDRRIRFERAGDTIVLEPPDEWKEGV